MKNLNLNIFTTLLIVIIMIIPVTAEEEKKTITNSQLGIYEGYNYELWKDSAKTGTASMTLTGGGSFNCKWSDINNALFRTGLKFDKTKSHNELGEISLSYDCDYQPDGNSYLSVYGWTTDPLVEFYIVESWGNWRPPGAKAKASITIDGAEYDIYETTRTNQPSIQGTATFQQYWSVRKEKRESGTISVSEHFKAWQELGMKMGKMYEVALVVEGYKSNGTANVRSNVISINGVEIGENPEKDTANKTETNENTVENEKNENLKTDNNNLPNPKESDSSPVTEVNLPVNSLLKQRSGSK